MKDSLSYEDSESLIKKAGESLRRERECEHTYSARTVDLKARRENFLPLCFLLPSLHSSFFIALNEHGNLF